MKRSPIRYTNTTTPKRDKIRQKSRSLLVHSGRVVYSSSKSWYKKVINASLTQNQCLQCVTRTNAALNACWDIATARRHWTEVTEHNDGMIKSGDVHYPTEPNLSIFQKGLINDDSSFCSHILLAIDVQCHVFPFEKFLLNVRLICL